MEVSSLNLRHQILHRETLVADRKAEMRHTIWMCELVDCAVKSNSSARNLIFVDSVMRGGSFSQQGLLNNNGFDRVRFEGVRFKGKFKGVDFGGRKDHPEYPVETGALEGCDLREAKLQQCRHFNGNFSSNQYAAWPTIVVKGGVELALPDGVSIDEGNWDLMISRYRVHPGGDYVLIDDAEEVSKRLSIPMDQLRAFLALNRSAVISGL